jgi:hypothetical protein
VISRRPPIVTTLLAGALGAALILSVLGSASAPPASAPQVVAQAAPAADFGEPPAGEYPILFNDRHVYATPTELKAGRVLSALVRGTSVLVPLRSMFEQMGATVAFDPSSKTVDVSKPGSDIKVTVGKPEVIVNGESRPLDVPPEIYRGVLMVPIRVVSEAMGAYVQWVPDRKTVVVRYVAAPAPPPPPAPTAEPSASPAPRLAPTPTPTLAPKKAAITAFVSGDALIGSKVYNELAPGVSGKNAYDVKGAVEIPLGPTGIMVGADFRQYEYDHQSKFGFIPCALARAGSCGTVVGNDFNYRGGTCPNTDPGCVTVIGHGAYEQVIGKGQAYVPAFTAQDRDYDARLGLKIAAPRVYIAASYLWRNFDYLGYPTQHGFGFGIDKLPDLDRPLSVYGSLYYYPSVSGTYTGPTSTLLGSLSGATFAWQYRVVKYEIGVTYDLRHTPVFVQAGWLGDKGTGKFNAPSDYSHNALFVGGGVHF